MPALRKRSREVESPASPPRLGNDDQTQTTETPKACLYEQSREQRIRENREKLEKLGIVDLSLKLKSQIHNRRTRIDSTSCKTPPRSQSVQLSGPLRRSSRLQNVTPVSYCEVPLKKDGSLENTKIVIEAGAKPELYTEEHERLLGNTEKSWTLFVDGYGNDGKRIYDSVKGKTCHQCRQKTLGYRTQCSKCNLVQGQFCGDCLYMRYGEHVLEALENPNWICPACRGICNCSLCRQGKGWAPTGPLYKKISSLGYKSVAHYLIQTRRSDSNEENDTYPPCPVSAKRSLPFSDMKAETLSNDPLEVNNNHLGSLKPQSENTGDQVSARKSLPFFDVQAQPENIGQDLETKKQPVSSSAVANSDSIARRLRSRLKKF
ncbi:hypothetical protein L6164_027778 [Bauhinia variegata]|uniref:Uncharacterized protein n=2 Tax=Bauhinia variegata TaxID=167791 RepID=A0ACB9LVN9_BAUVA|nr:hypothetical protein L6164_027778 [Bauhinia variegata]